MIVAKAHTRWRRNGSCTTDSNGNCIVAKNNLRSSSPAIFSVTNILDALGSPIYDGFANHDDDVPSDSNGTTITLEKP